MKISAVIQVAGFFLPWRLRRALLRAACGFTIHPTANIGYSIILAKELRMGAGSKIGHATLINAIDRVVLGERSKIGNLNWISGIASGNSKHFADEAAREPELHLGVHASITGQHFIDCCNKVTIGDFTIVAGTRSQILSHAINIKANRQMSAPVEIGRYCFIGTGSIILKGARLPDCSVLAAGSTLNKAHTAPYTLYSGVPAAGVKSLDPGSLFFSRESGRVD